MAKKNGIVKISGDLLHDKEVREAVRVRLRKIAEQYSLVIISGGGTDINKAFKERGFDIKFCPLGRVTDTLEQRQLARNILEQNQAAEQDMLDEDEISARVVIPMREIGTVLCPENGDLMFLSAYLGFDKGFIFTKKERVEAKKSWLVKIAQAFEHIERGGELEKIEVVGF